MEEIALQEEQIEYQEDARGAESDPGRSGDPFDRARAVQMPGRPTTSNTPKARMTPSSAISTVPSRKRDTSPMRDNDQCLGQSEFELSRAQ